MWGLSPGPHRSLQEGATSFVPGPVCEHPFFPVSCSYGGHPDLREAAVSGARGYTASCRGAPVLTAAVRRSYGDGAGRHEPACAHSEHQTVWIRRPTFGTVGLLI